MNWVPDVQGAEPWKLCGRRAGLQRDCGHGNAQTNPRAGVGTAKDEQRL